jgi:hypothetical protein
MVTALSRHGTRLFLKRKAKQQASRWPDAELLFCLRQGATSTAILSADMTDRFSAWRRMGLGDSALAIASGNDNNA